MFPRSTQEPTVNRFIRTAVLAVTTLMAVPSMAQSPAAEVEQNAEEVVPHETPKNIITLRPKMWIIATQVGVGGTAGFAVEYERGLGDMFSVFVAPSLELVPFAMPGAELGARYFFSGDAPHGFAVGVQFAGTLFNFGTASALLLTPSAGVNYTGIWDSGFTMSVGAGVGYTLATAGSAAIPLGLTFPVRFALGWAF
jgi:hypothetical protein